MQEKAEDRPVLSAAEIVDGMRSEDSAKRQAAIDALYPEGQGAILMRVLPTVTQTSATTRCDAARCFAGLLFVAQQFGRHLGLQLGWVPEAPDPTKIEVAPGSALRGGPGAFR